MADLQRVVGGALTQLTERCLVHGLGGGAERALLALEAASPQGSHTAGTCTVAPHGFYVCLLRPHGVLLCWKRPMSTFRCPSAGCSMPLVDMQALDARWELPLARTMLVGGPPPSTG